LANVQKQFEAFHEAIKLGKFDENQILRDKRDIIRQKLEDQLLEIFEMHGQECPVFSFRDQGSYALDTGIKPLDGDYDIDQGLYFEVCYTDYPDPVVLKQRVYEVLEKYTQNIRIRQPCVTVFYQLADEPIYHVDIAVYSSESKNPDGKARLARGKSYSAPENRYWEISDPEGLSATIFVRFDKETAREQFRRIVRYLKRWKDVNFLSDGNAAPRGIALTIAAYDYLQETFSDFFSRVHDDLRALRTLISTLLRRFTYEWDETEQTFVRRLVVKLPVEPGNDLFERMTNNHMEDLEAKLKALLKALDAAADAVDPIEACERLQDVFGDDFPVPSKEETAKQHRPAIVSSGSSA
jgi:hypothetical protein